MSNGHDFITSTCTVCDTIENVIELTGETGRLTYKCIDCLLIFRFSKDEIKTQFIDKDTEIVIFTVGTDDYIPDDKAMDIFSQQLAPIFQDTGIKYVIVPKNITEVQVIKEDKE